MTDKKFAVLGKPIGHSLSPTIHRAAYEVLGLDWSYEKFEIPEGGLQHFLERDGSQFEGFSITMPLKVEAAQVAAVQDPLVVSLGIANTLVRDSGKLHAYNTDVFGISQALKSSWKVGISEVAILGSGATAQSALAAIRENSPSSSVTVYVRDLHRTKAIAELAAKLGMRLEVRRIEDYSNKQDLTVNTIPSNSLPIEPVEQAGWLLDANYASADMNLSSSFHPARVITGKAMLIWQAIAQIRIFLTGDPSKELPNEVQVLEAMFASL